MKHRMSKREEKEKALKALCECIAKSEKEVETGWFGTQTHSPWK